MLVRNCEWVLGIAWVILGFGFNLSNKITRISAEFKVVLNLMPAKGSQEFFVLEGGSAWSRNRIKK